MKGLDIRKLRAREFEDAARLLGRAMCDNPINIRAFGMRNTDHRCHALARFFIPVLHGLYRRGFILGGFRRDGIVAVCGVARPGRCRPPLAEKLRVLPAVLFGNQIGATLRVFRWIGEWARRDPSEPHWHLGPVAVDSHLQGHGIGDDCAALSYLETDKSENVRF